MLSLRSFGFPYFWEPLDKLFESVLNSFELEDPSSVDGFLAHLSSRMKQPESEKPADRAVRS
jgi:hypothetical protein